MAIGTETGWRVVRVETIVEMFRSMEYAERELNAMNKRQSTEAGQTLAHRVSGVKDILRELEPEACDLVSWRTQEKR